jgi:hypothetical protein
MTDAEKLGKAREALELAREGLSSSKYDHVIQGEIDAAISILSTSSNPLPIDRDVAEKFCKTVKVIQQVEVNGVKKPDEIRYPFDTLDNIENMTMFLMRHREAAVKAEGERFVTLFNAALDASTNKLRASDKSLHLVMSDPFCNRMSKSILALMQGDGK